MPRIGWHRYLWLGATLLILLAAVWEVAEIRRQAPQAAGAGASISGVERPPRYHPRSNGSVDEFRRRQAVKHAREQAAQEDRRRKAREVAEQKRRQVIARQKQKDAAEKEARRKEAEAARIARERELRIQRELFERELRIGLLHEAKAMALASAEPWRELLAVALLQRQFNDFGGMRDSFDKAEKLARDPMDPIATGKALTDLIKAVLHAREVDLALDIARRMNDGHFQDQAYRRISHHFARSGEIASAKTLVQVISDEKIQQQALAAISGEEVRRTGADAAISTIGLISNLELRDDALLRVSRHQARLGDSFGALATIDLISDGGMRDRGKANLAENFLNKGIARQALNLARGIDTADTRDKLYGRIVSQLSKAADWGRARQTIALILDKRQRDQARRTVAVSLAKQGSFALAMQQLGLIIDPKVRAASMRDLALIEAERQGLPGARRLVDQIGDERARDQALAGLAMTEIRKGGGLSRAGQLVEAMEDWSGRQKTKLRLAELSLKTGQVLQARRLLLEVEHEFAASGEPASSALQQRLVELMGRSGGIRDAVQRAENFRDPQTRDSLLGRLARSRAEQEDFDGAQSIAMMINNDRVRDQSFQFIAARLGRQVELQDANQAMSRLHTPEEKLRFILSFFRS